MDRDEWDERYASQELVWGAGPNRFVVAELADLPPGRALDLATGEGRNAIWLAEHGWQVTAVDFSAAGLAKAGQLAADRLPPDRAAAITWVQADLLEYEPSAESFDLVVIAYLHLAPADIGRVLGSASSALAQGGTLLVVGHDRDNITHGYGGPQVAAILHNADELVSALPGLLIRKAEQARRPVETAEGERVAIDTLVRAQRP